MVICYSVGQSWNGISSHMYHKILLELLVSERYVKSETLNIQDKYARFSLSHSSRVAKFDRCEMVIYSMGEAKRCFFFLIWTMFYGKQSSQY